MSLAFFRGPVKMYVRVLSGAHSPGPYFWDPWFTGSVYLERNVCFFVVWLFLMNFLFNVECCTLFQLVLVKSNLSLVYKFYFILLFLQKQKLAMSATFTYLIQNHGLKLRLTADCITQTSPLREMQRKTQFYWGKSVALLGLVWLKTPGNG